MRDRTVLLIGGTGFIGTALARKLVTAGYSVHVIARHAPESPVAEAVMHAGNMDDAVLLESILPACGTVVHLACVTTPGASVNQPQLEVSENVFPTLRLLDVLTRHPEVRLQFFSSGGTLYGDARVMPVKEDSPLAPRSYFGAGKMAVEGFLHAFGAQGNRNVVILRPANAYGPGQAHRRGFGIVRTMLEHLRAGTPMEFWGDGEIVRDFVYIDDLIDACYRLIEGAAPSGNYNLGSGKGYSLNQLRTVAERVCGARLEVVFARPRALDVMKVTLDSSRIKREFGWTPRVDMEEGIRRTWNWLVSTQG